MGQHRVPRPPLDTRVNVRFSANHDGVVAVVQNFELDAELGLDVPVRTCRSELLREIFPVTDTPEIDDLLKTTSKNLRTNLSITQWV